jgi:hypothetical protein
VSFPSIFGFGESNPNSVVKGKQLACLIPGQMVDGKLVRRSPQAAGTGYMVSAYAKNPELAYLFHPVVHESQHRRRRGCPP